MSRGATKKEYLLISSDFKEPGSVSSTDFMLRMKVPIKDVVKTDLVELSMVYVDTPPTGKPPYFFIQSRALGTDIQMANGNIGFWRMLKLDEVNGGVLQPTNRVDSYVNEPTTLQDIDIKVVYPDGTVVDNGGGRLTLLLEIVRLL